MRTHPGRISEIQIDLQGEPSAWVACPPQAIPAPGQYVRAWAAEGPHYTLAASLFPASISEESFRAAPPLPLTWQPGLALSLHGPLGRGFRLGEPVRRLALAAFDSQAARLMPLADRAMKQGGDVALFTDAVLPHLPPSFELYPLASLPDALSWADFLAVDISLPGLKRLRPALGLGPEAHLPCLAQALVVTPMPCGGLADCGACAVPARRGWRLACQDGPVFNLHELDW